MLKKEIKNSLNYLLISLSMVFILGGEIYLISRGNIECSLNPLMIFTSIIMLNSSIILMINSDYLKDSIKQIIYLIKNK
jgi:hypothetical protein